MVKEIGGIKIEGNLERDRPKIGMEVVIGEDMSSRFHLRRIVKDKEDSFLIILFYTVTNCNKL